MADIRALRSYLVSLGFAVNTTQAAQFNNAIKTASQVVHTNTTNIVGNLAKWGVAAVAMFEGMGVAALAMAEKVAKADQEYRLFGERMFMDTKHAKTLKIALDALGQPLDAIAFDPELHGRFDQLQALQDRLQGQLGGNFPQVMIQLRDAQFEFTKLRVEALYFRDLLIKDLFQALGGEKLTAKLREWNEFFTAHIPKWAGVVSKYLAPVLTDAWDIMKSLFTVAKDFAQIFTNIVGLISGDETMQGTVSFEKFAHALQTTAHWLAVVLELVSKFSGTIIGATALSALGGTVGGLIGLATGGPAGAVAGAATGTTVGGVAGGSVGAMIDLIRATFGNEATNANDANGDNSIKSLAAQVGAQLGVSPNIIYSQWAHETGNFNNRGAKSLNNLAGIRMPGSSEYQQFGSLADFGNYYTGLIQRKYSNALGAQSIDEYATALKRGGYFQDSLQNYERGMHSFEGAYGGGASSNVQINSINIMQPNATPEQIVKAISDGIEQHQDRTTSVNLNQFRTAY